MIEKIGCFSITEKNGMWTARVSKTYPVAEPKSGEFETYQKAHEWCIGHYVSSDIHQGFLIGMFYVWG